MSVSIPHTNGLDDSAIRDAEVQLGCLIPSDYRTFVLKHDGATPAPNIFASSQNQSEVRRFVRLSEAASLRASIEGFPSKAIPVAEDSCGNYVWLDHKTGAVFFWDHELEQDGEKIADSFEAFLASLEPFDPQSVRLEPGQVKSVWVDPSFKPEFD